MPLYDYECRSCGKVTEVRHGFKETHTDACPSCGGELARRFSAAAIVFKGSGFYVTDSRKSSGGDSGKTETKSEPTTSEPAKTEPVKTEPAKSESSTTGSGPSKTEAAA